MAEGHIVLAHVRKSFGPKHVLNGVNLSVPKGHSLVVIGGSGTGKSVMLKCILGILQPDQGSIRIAGEEVVGLKGKDRDAYLSRFGMLFQGAALFDSLPVWENVAFGLIIAVMGCYHGFNSRGGAQGVGRATTNAVVSASILILAANFVLTNLLFSE